MIEEELDKEFDFTEEALKELSNARFKDDTGKKGKSWTEEDLFFPLSVVEDEEYSFFCLKYRTLEVMGMVKINQPEEEENLPDSQKEMRKVNNILSDAKSFQVVPHKSKEGHHALLVRDFLDNVYLVIYQVLHSVKKLGDFDDIKVGVEGDN